MMILKEIKNVKPLSSLAICRLIVNVISESSKKSRFIKEQKGKALLRSTLGKILIYGPLSI